MTLYFGRALSGRGCCPTAHTSLVMLRLDYDLYLKSGASWGFSPFRKPAPMELQHVAQPRCVLPSLNIIQINHPAKSPR